MTSFIENIEIYLVGLKVGTKSDDYIDLGIKILLYSSLFRLVTTYSIANEQPTRKLFPPPERCNLIDQCDKSLLNIRIGKFCSACPFDLPTNAAQWLHQWERSP